MITLVVPVFNMEEYLPRCMNHLLEQNGDYEIILVDDGSTDSSGILCDKYAAQYSQCVKVIHKENGGLSSARNAGMDFAKGEYVIFPDPDDWVESNFIDRLTILQEKYHPDLLCIGHYIEFDTYTISANDGHAIFQMDGKNAQISLLRKPCMNGFAWNKLYHLDIIRSHDLKFLDNVGTTEDLDFAFRYLQYCKQVVFSPEDRLYHYYQRSGAATHSSFSQKKMESIRTYEKMIKTSVDNEIIRAAEEEICNTAINLIWSFKNSQVQDEDTWRKLRHYLQRYLKQYCISNYYGIGRKVQAILACYIPELYIRLKNKITQEV